MEEDPLKKDLNERLLPRESRKSNEDIEDFKS